MAANASVFYSQPASQPYQGKAIVFSENYVGIKIYTVNFNLVKNTDSTLADLKFNGILVDNFDPQKFTYNEILPYTDLNAPVVTATPNYPFAQVNITQIDTIQGTVIIHIVAEDTDFEATYTIHFTREQSPVIDIDTVKYSYNGQNYTYAVSNNNGINIVLPVETQGVPVISSIVLADNRANYIIDEQPNTNNLMGTLIVTAEDLTVDTVEVIFQRTLSSSISLTDISYNAGSGNVSVFDPNTTTYNVILPFNHVQIPTVSATADWVNTIVNITQPSSTFGQSNISVQSEDGQNNITYYVNFIRQGDVNLASLSYSIRLNGIDTTISVPNFNPAVLEYYVVLPIATTNVPVLTYMRNDSRTQVSQNVLSSPSGTIQLTIITADGIPDTLTYTVHFNVILSTEALLSDLQVDGITIDNFNPNTLNYVVEYAYGKMDLPLVTAEATQPDARVDIMQIDDYPQTAIITVYAGDTTIFQTYTISFSVEAGDNNYLTELFVDSTLLFGFDKDVYYYEIYLPYGTTQLPEITDAVAQDPRAILTITQATQLGEMAEIEVLALNGEIAVYQIFFILKKNPNAYAKNIFIDWDALENFNPTTRNYTYYLPVDYKGVPFVTAELDNPNASYIIVPPTSLPAQIQIVITAEDGETQFTYRINFEKTLSVVSYDNSPVEISLYPNPSSDKIHFVVSGSSQTSRLELYTVEGKMMGNYILQEGVNTIQINDFANGMYFYKIFSDKIMLGTGRFVKNK
jgi:hypothetical protein